MATLVCFHAHPDDEAIATGGAMMKAVADGHEVVLIVATRGEQGEPAPGVLNDGELLGDRREAEARQAATILEVTRVDFLPYEDSGMAGEPSNENPKCFWQADVEVAAELVAGILRDVDADAITVYDEHGGYGHPDHIQVHRVGRRAAELAGIERVFWATMNRDRIKAQMAEFQDNGLDEEDVERVDSEDFGSPEADITHAIDVSAFTARKREAMKAHASQITEDSFFLAMPDDVFELAFGTEWFIAQGENRDGDFETSLF